MILPKVELPPQNYNVNYTYRLADSADDEIEPEFEIGDFSPLPNPPQYYDSNPEFADNAKQKIKELAEKLYK